MRTMKVTLVSGRVDSGKTSLLRRRVAKGDGEYREAAGILSLPVFRNGKKRGYYAYDIAKGEGMVLSSELPLHPSFKFRRFYFSEYGFSFARERILASFHAPVLIVDEIGPLELEGGGFAGVLKECVRGYDGHLVLVVREHLEDEALSAFGLDEFEISVTSPREEGAFHE
jgi:nucleoside-triphosphatase THEP1